MNAQRRKKWSSPLFVMSKQIQQIDVWEKDPDPYEQAGRVEKLI